MSRISKFKFDKNLIYWHKYNYDIYFSYRYYRLFFKSLIFRGRKLWAFNFMINLRYELKIREQVDPFLTIFVALLKITPDILTYPLKLGGVVQRVPLPISERKQLTFAVKWVIKLLKDKYGKVKVKQVVDALYMAIRGKGLSIEKKKTVYTTSIINRHLLRFFRF